MTLCRLRQDLLIAMVYGFAFLLIQSLAVHKQKHNEHSIQPPTNNEHNNEVESSQESEPAQIISSQLQYFSGFEMNELKIEGSDLEDALIKLIHSPNNVFIIGLLAEYGTLIFNIGRINIIECKPGIFKIGTTAVQVQSVSVLTGSIIYKDVKQWKLVVQEDFWNKPIDWTDNSITTCGGVHMLGGYGKFSGGIEIKKTFTEIPLPHSFIRVVATYHFIDAWSGETGFMRINSGKKGAMEYVWTSKYDFSKSVGGINICGADYPEGRFGSKIDLTLRHTTDTVTIGFGSTLDQDPYENSYGISNLQIYIR